ncbi:6635_t:CDS:2, partial [Dentiscutata heterogama]
MKAALNLALDIGCKDELVDIISGFIDQKKTSLNSKNYENYENFNSNEIDSSISTRTTQGMKENTKWKYVCNTCRKLSHNSQ